MRVGADKDDAIEFRESEILSRGLVALGNDGGVASDVAGYKVQAILRKYSGDQLDVDGLSLKAGASSSLLETLAFDGNMLMSAGALQMLQALRGDSLTAFDNTHAQIGVGDSSVAEVASQTTLQAVGGTPLTITGATNANPIEITTSAPHGLLTGAVATIASVGGNTNANGTWEITKTGASTFTLNSRAGNSAYTSGGTATPYNRYRKGMASTYPLVGTGDGLVADNLISFSAVFGVDSANFAWNEWGLFNGGAATQPQTGNLMLNRKVKLWGTKVIGSTWTLTITIGLY